MSLLGGILLGGLLFGGRSCSCDSCIKAREEKDKEYKLWLKKHPYTSSSSGVITSTSVSTSPSTYIK